MTTEIKLRLGSDVGSFVQGLRQAKNELQKFQNASKDVGAALKRMGAPYAQAGKDLQKVSQNIGTTAKQMGATLDQAFANLGSRIGQSLGKAKASILNLRTALLTLGVGASVKAAVTLAASFEKNLADISTLLDESSVSISRYRQQLLALAATSSKDIIDLSRGLYQTISAGIPAIEGASGAFALLEAAQRAAVAGLSTTEEAVNGIVSVVQAYRDSGITAAEVSDKMFLTVAKGRVDFSNLSGSIGQVAGTAAAFGVRVDELLGSVAALTAVLPSPEQAMVSIQAVLNNLITPSKEAAEGFARLGVDVSAAAVQQRGLIPILADIRNGLDGDSDAMAKLFPDIRALRGAAILLGTGFKDLNVYTNAIAESTGATDRAYQKIQPTFDETARLLKAKLNAVMIEAATKILPDLAKAIDKVGAFLVENQAQIADMFQSLVRGLLSIAEFVASSGETILHFVEAFAAAWVGGKVVAAIAAVRSELLLLKAASATTGLDAGGRFVTGFGKAAATIPTVLRTVLKSAGLLGLALGIGYEVVDGIINYFTEGATRAAKEFATATFETLNVITQKMTGFKTLADAAKARPEFEAGKLVSTAKFGAFQEGALLTPEQAVAKRGISQAEIDAEQTALKLVSLSLESDRAAQAAWKRGQALIADQNAAARAGSIGEVQRIEAQRTALREELNTRTALAKQQKEAAQTVVRLTQEAIGKQLETEAKAAGFGRKKAQIAKVDDGAKAERDRQKAAEEALKAEADAREAILERQIEEIEGQTNWEFALQSKLLDEQERNEIASIHRRFAASIEAAGKDVEQRGFLERQLAAETLVTEQEFTGKRSALFKQLLDERTDEERKAAKEREEADKAHLEALRAEISLPGAQQRLKEEALGQAEAVEPALQIAAALQTEGLGEGAAAAGQLLAGGAQEAALLLTGPIGQFATVLFKLPDILNGLADFLQTGITDFVSGLGEAIEAVIVGLIEGFPDQIDNLLTKVIPSLIEHLVAALPRIIGGLIILLPRLMFAVIKAMVVLPIALVKGIIAAFKDIDLGLDALRDGATAAGDALRDGAAAFLEGVKAAAKWFVDQIKSVLGFGPAPGEGDPSKRGLIRAGQGAVLGAGVGTLILPGPGTIIGAGVGFLAGGALGGLGIWHKGGVIGPGGRNLAIASALMDGGAQQFALGGLIRRGIRDDVPILAQAGEAILSRRGVEAAGGTQGVGALNDGRAPASPGLPTVVQLVARDGDEVAKGLMALVLQRIQVQAASPLGGGIGRSLAGQSRVPFLHLVPSRAE